MFLKYKFKDYMSFTKESFKLAKRNQIKVLESVIETYLKYS